MITRQRVKPHDFIVEGNIAKIVCYGMQGQVRGEIIIDVEDLDRCKKHKWNISFRRGLVMRAIMGGCKPLKNTKMVHFLFGKAPEGYEWDHINRNPIDNRRANLRLCTVEQNQWNRGLTKANSSGFKGVIKHEGKWMAIIWHNKRPIYLGFFADKQDAALAYNKAAKKLKGHFAWLNIVT